ncbi:MAG: hypothetical protein KUL87_09755 [Pseudomonas sp.]|nr:hypothetical protein [Pseudomonas sp.]
MSIHWKAYHLNRMIQDAFRNPAAMERLMNAEESVFEEYRFSEAEKEAFRDPNPAALRAIGVHPILAMVYMIPRDETARKTLTVDPLFLEQLKEVH